MFLLFHDCKWSTEYLDTSVTSHSDPSPMGERSLTFYHTEIITQWLQNSLNYAMHPTNDNFSQLYEAIRRHGNDSEYCSSREKLLAEQKKPLN